MWFVLQNIQWKRSFWLFDEQQGSNQPKEEQTKKSRTRKI